MDLSIKNLCSFWIIRTEYTTMIIYGYPIRSIHLLISKFASTSN